MSKLEGETNGVIVQFGIYAFADKLYTQERSKLFTNSGGHKMTVNVQRSTV